MLLVGSLVATNACALAETDEIRYVIDGDTVVRADGRHVRLIGINAPEPGKDGAPDQPLARAARARLAELVEIKRVTLVYEQEREDRHGRLLARLVLPDDSEAGERLLREGLAWSIAVPPNLEKLSSNLAAEHEARHAKRGVWQVAAYAPKPANRLSLRDTGFQFIQGKVQRTGQGRHLLYFDLSPEVTLTVAHENWNKYFKENPATWVGRTVVARGWLTESRGRLRMRVTHPAMLTWSQ